MNTIKYFSKETSFWHLWFSYPLYGRQTNRQVSKLIVVAVVGRATDGVEGTYVTPVLL